MLFPIVVAEEPIGAPVYALPCMHAEMAVRKAGTANVTPALMIMWHISA